MSIEAKRSNVTCGSAYCASCENGKCTDCIDMYLIVNGKCVFKYKENCLNSDNHYSDPNFCSICFDGYHIDTSTGLCVSGEFGCSSAGYNNINNKIICYDFKCKNNELLNRDGCLDCSEKNPYCFKLKNGASDCLQCEYCKNGAVLNSRGYCEMIDPYCRSFKMDSQNKETTNCNSCAAGYFINENGKCQKGEIENCEEYKDKSNCKNCLNGGTIENGKCVPCKIEHCESCNVNDKTKCEDCVSGFSKTADGKCERVQSECHYYNHNINNGRCESCIDGYYLGINGKCLPFGNGCASEFNGNCTKCLDGYYLDKTGDKPKCIACTGDCKTCESAGYCYSCKENGKVSVKGICFKEIANCSRYNEIDGKCLECIQGYTLNSQTGNCDTDGCRVKGEGQHSNKCIECLIGYYMKEDYTCGKCDKSCFKCSHTPTTCFSEYSNLPTKCVVFNENGKCTKCHRYYDLVDGDCKQRNHIEETGCYEEINVDPKNVKCVLCTKIDRYRNDSNPNDFCQKEDGFCTTWNYFFSDKNGQCIDVQNKDDKKNGSDYLLLSLIFALIFFIF